jgi:hypothetical protein
MVAWLFKILLKKFKFFWGIDELAAGKVTGVG